MHSTACDQTGDGGTGGRLPQHRDDERAIRRNASAVERSERTMPLYYFHLTDGKETVNNPQGMDLPGTAAAREEAMVLARDLKHGKVMPGRSWDGWRVSVVDQHGHQVESVPIEDLLGE
jgi:hypothetical protein